MDHIKALAIKFISSFVLLYIILGLFYDMSFGNVLLVTLVLGAASYIIGDMFILPRTNNAIATFADFGLAFMIIWLMGANLTNGNNLLTVSFISAAGVALFEYLFHKYISNRTITKTENENNRTGDLRYQTEASEELTPNRTDTKDENEDKL
jgi:membrane protein implicated in regulation of membrane protease activity